MAFWVYVLRCADGSYYTGHTDDLEIRIAQHQAGAYPGYTHDRRPVDLMFSEELPTRIDALDRERQIKDWSRAKKEALFRGDWASVSHTASSRQARTERDQDGDQHDVGSGRASTSATPDANGSEGSSPPAIVLVRPQLAENIGKAARAMLNFGLTDLRLVAPRDGWPNPAAGPAASGADAVLANARVFDSVSEAVADCAHVYATTVRKRGVTKPVVGPDEAGAAMRVAPERSAVLFGPERSGLETDDVAIARTILTVPINPEFGSLNLAQAVILVAYEWSRGRGLVQPSATELDPPAPQADLDGMIAQWDEMLARAGYFFPPDRAATVRRTLRGLLTRPGWTAQEVRTMRGMLSTLDRPRPARG